MKFHQLFLILTVLIFAGCTQTAVSDTNTIEISSSGFVPSSIAIKQGETVTFINKDSFEHWPASALHPTHTTYPEPGGCIGSKFDACKGLKENESFTFTFDIKGSWKYHDHLNPNLFGTVNVE